jgi:hypothetical protein
MSETNTIPVARFPSGRDLFLCGFVEEGYRFKPVIAGAASPEIGDAARTLFNPVRRGDRLAALGTGVSSGQIAKICSGHGSLPLTSFDVFDF